MASDDCTCTGGSPFEEDESSRIEEDGRVTDYFCRVSLLFYRVTKELI